MANIDPFVLGSHVYDLDGLTHDLLTKMVNDHTGHNNATSHRELCRYYFDPHRINLEGRFLITNILQRARGILQEGGWFLDYRPRWGWFVAQTDAEALEHLRRYAKREINLNDRLQAKAFIAIGNNYQLEAGGELIQAIQGMTPAIERLEQAVEEAEPEEEESE